MKKDYYKKIAAVTLSLAMFASSFPNMDMASVHAAATDSANIAVVNFDSTWGNVDANVDKMIDYINEAEAADVDMLVFPEMAVNGYCWSNDLEDAESKMAVETAETKDGETATAIAELADQYDMWIAYGATEVVPGDDKHAYNSVFACSPEGEVTTYQKIHPVEGVWCESGTTPVILDTDFGKVGISICYDTYAVPELERYYVAQGCQMFINPTATSRGSYTEESGDLNTTNWQWYYEDRLESIVDRDGVYIASADLAGKEYDSEGNLLYNFPGGSVVIGPGGSSSSGKYTENYAGSPSEQTPGMYCGTITLSTARGSDIRGSSNFQPELYTKWYADLADDDANDKIASPVKSDPVVATVNFQAVWGDLDANLEQMIDYITDAAKSDTDIIVFPEMALQGYCSSSNASSETYRLAVDKAITKKGYYAKTLSEYAKKYDMYVIFGASEKIPAEENPEDTDQAYNSAFCCAPDGKIYSYQKIQPVEGSWCMKGKTPVMIETPFGGLGLSICKDTYSYPELERYYSAKGCTFIVNPTATSRGGASRWSWYYSRRLESIVDRDKMVVISSDLCGPQYDAAGNTHSTFPGGSCIMAPLRSAANGSYVDYIAGSSDYDPTAVGMEIGTVKLNSKKYSIGFSISGFRPSLYSAMYGILAGTTDISEITPAPAALISESEVTLTEAQKTALAVNDSTVSYTAYTVNPGLTTPFAAKSIYSKLTDAVKASLPADSSSKVFLLDGDKPEEVKTTYASGKASFNVEKEGTYIVATYKAANDKPSTGSAITPGSSKPSVSENTPYSFIKKGTKIYVSQDGKIITGTKGIITINGKKYIIDKTGAIIKSGKKQLVKIGKKTYIVNANGTVIIPKSKKTVKVGKKTYIVKNKGTVFMPKTSKTVKIGKKKYKVNRKGIASRLF